MTQEMKTTPDRTSFAIQKGSIGQEIRLNLPAFEGPMDLLLYLIKREEVDIFDIPVSLLADRYLSFLKIMEADNLDIGGEFLVMAATLLSIKARMLLPRNVEEMGEIGEEDPRRDLVERILEYKAFKESARLFRELEEKTSKQFFKGTGQLQVNEDEVKVETALQDVSLYDLLSAFKLAIDQFKAEKPSYSLQMYAFSVDEKMVELRELLGTGKKIAFSEIIRRQKTKLEIVVMFLALLELVRVGEVTLRGTSHGDFAVSQRVNKAL